MLRAAKIEETPFYRVIFSEGKEKGRVEGRVEGAAREVRAAIDRLKQELEDTKAYFSDGDITERLYQRRMVTLKTELAQMEQRLEALETPKTPEN